MALPEPQTFLQKHLPKNPKFQEIQDTTIPCQMDKILITTSTNDIYAKKLVTILPQSSDSDKKKYVKMPGHAPLKQNQFIFDNSQFPTLGQYK